MALSRAVLQSFEFSIDGEMQLEFARVSGDFNPIHIDPIAARRLLFGERVVHGIHVVLRMIDEAVNAAALDGAEIGGVAAVFKGPVPVEARVCCQAKKLEQSGSEWVASVDGIAVCLLVLRYADSPTELRASLTTGLPPQDGLEQVLDGHLETARGTLPLFYNSDLIGRLCPNLGRVLTPHGVAVLLASSRLVGMKCPGLHSVFSEIRVTLPGMRQVPVDNLQYEVVRFDQRYRRVDIRIASGAGEGRVRCFVRPGPQDQASMRELANSAGVRPGEFASMRALVIGASRGLGETAAKLVALGGARVLVGYASGADDAIATRDDILASGYQADVVQFDVLDPEEGAGRVAGLGLPTSVFYFAAPFIRAGRGGAFSPDQFQVYCDYFVRGFSETVAALRGIGCSPLEVLYPSSAYVDPTPPGMFEYAASKAAGEYCCRAMQRDDLKVEHVRLDRLATDQTQGLLPDDLEEPAPSVLRAIRKLRGRV